MDGACKRYEGEGRCIQGFGGKPEGKRPLGRFSRRWENNITMELQEVGCGSVDRDRWRALVNVVMNLRVP